MARPMHFSGCTDPTGFRNFSQSFAFRAEHFDWDIPARALSGGLTSTSQSVNTRRWQRRGKAHLSFDQDDYSWRGSAGLVWGNEEEDRRFKTNFYARRGQGKSNSIYRVSVQCLSPSEAHTAPENTVTPSTLWEGLRPTINYLSGAQLCMVSEALQLAFEAHDGQKRKSGEPFIIHPVEVANILGELEMDWETIVAGLLHDTVEDTEHVTFERIEEQFGSVVRRIVEGETKVSKLGKMQCQQSASVGRDVKADDLRQMFLAMTEEVRVIIVKLADRLHNMRTLGHMPPHKQKYIAQETLQVFAPLAKLLGMFRIKSELEDLSFKFANGDEYKSLQQRVSVLRKEQEEVVLEGRTILLEIISKDQFLGYMTADVKVRTHYKELYSLYKKMVEKKCPVDEIRDIAQLRVVLKLKPGAAVGKLCTAQQVCYHVLGLIHAMWPPVPGTMKDYIATPKPNGYQSLHTTVIPFGSKTYFPLEIQIRTEEMDKLAEWGVAAHHSGRGILDSEPDIIGVFSGNGVVGTKVGTKVGANGSAHHGWSNNLNDAEIARRVSWLNSIREWQEEFVGNMTSREFVDTITGDLLGSRVFVFTPKGEVKNLPKGATVVDYAYQIHTDVGNKMVAAKVNGNIVSPSHTLANAEVVEIVTYEGASQKKLFELHRQWLQFARTRSARHKLTKFLKEQAAISAEELTMESIKDFVAQFSEPYLDDGDEDDKEEQPGSDLYVRSSNGNGTHRAEYLSSHSESGERETGQSFGPLTNGTAMNGSALNKSALNGAALNGKHGKFVDGIFGKMGTGRTNDHARASSSSEGRLSIEDEARAKFEAWQTGRVAMWHGSGGRSLQWLSICCVDRRRMLAEVSALLGAAGILICACAAETDQIRGLGIMIFQIEAEHESLVQACANIEGIGGILNWAVGCSWQSPRTTRQYR